MRWSTEAPVAAVAATGGRRSPPVRWAGARGRERWADVLVAGRYRVEDPLGRGGMGEVWRATDELLGRQVAVKLLRAGADDADAVERFHHEARTAARLNHPHVVAVYDFGSHGDQRYLVMEYVPGRSLLRELALCGALEPERAARIGAQVARGLAAAHGQGIVHRDVKPGNLLLGEDGTVKIADFGIARFLADSSSALTTTGQVLGTSAYLAPERGLGRPAGPPSDVYALGCVVYELLTGRPPFCADHPAAVVFQHVDATPEPPSRIRPGLPDALSEGVLRLLAKDPGERPSAEQAAAWFADCRTATAWAPAAPAGRGATLPVPVHRHRRRRTLLGAAGVIAAGAATLVGLTSAPGTEHPASHAPVAPSHTARVSPSAAAALPSPVAEDASDRVEPVAATGRAPATGAAGPAPHAKAHGKGGPKKGKAKGHAPSG